MIIVIATAVVISFVLGITPMANDDVDKAEAWGQELRLRDAQEGFVGETGKILIIDPTGDWRLLPFVQDQELPIEKQGKLSPEELKRLTHSFQVHGFDQLPATIAPIETPSVNNRIVTLSYAGKTVTLTTVPAASAHERRAAMGKDEQQLLSIVNSVHHATTNN
jgi:hypothetical protein